MDTYTEPERISLGDWGWRLALSVLIWWAADLAAIEIFYWNPSLIGYTDKSKLLLELFSFTHTLALLGIGFTWYPICRKRPSLLYPFFGFIVLAAVYLTLFQWKN